MLDFLCSKQFYLPIIYIAVGIILYGIIAGSINKFSKFKFKPIFDSCNKKICLNSLKILIFFTKIYLRTFRTSDIM